MNLFASKKRLLFIIIRPFICHTGCRRTICIQHHIPHEVFSVLTLDELPGCDTSPKVPHDKPNHSSYTETPAYKDGVLWYIPTLSTWTLYLSSCVICPLPSSKINELLNFLNKNHAQITPCHHVSDTSNLDCLPFLKM